MYIFFLRSKIFPNDKMIYVNNIGQYMINYDYFNWFSEIALAMCQNNK